MRPVAEVVTLRLHPERRRELQAEAKGLGRTLSQHIRSILDEHRERTYLQSVMGEVGERLQAVEKQVRRLRRELREATTTEED